MNVIAFYVMTKENVNRKIAEKTADLYFEGMSYKEALEKAKEMYKEISFYKKKKYNSLI